MTTKERNYGLKKKCEDLQHENKVLKKALELACERIKNMYEQEQQYCTNEIENFTQVEFDYFIDQAEKEVGNETNK